MNTGMSKSWDSRNKRLGKLWKLSVLFMLDANFLEIVVVVSSSSKGNGIRAVTTASDEFGLISSNFFNCFFFMN